MMDRIVSAGCAVAASILVLGAQACKVEPLFAQRYPVGDGPRSVVVADLDGDTVPDLVAVNYMSLSPSGQNSW